MLKKIWKVIKLIWKWLVYSSSNAGSISLFVKSVGVAIIPFLLLITKAYKLEVSSEFFTAIIDQICAVIIVFLGAVSGIYAAWGALRKVLKTINGTNDVINLYSKE